LNQVQNQITSIEIVNFVSSNNLNSSIPVILPCKHCVVTKLNKILFSYQMF